MKISAKFDTSAFKDLSGKRAKRLVYAVVNGLNEVAKNIQKAEQAKLRERFTVRKDFTVRQVAIIKPFASVGQARLYVEISVGQRNKLLLSVYEEGGPRLPFKGKNVAVPVIGEEARPTKQASVDPSYLFTKLGLKTTTTKKGRQQIKGRQRTYIVPGVGVFKRVGGKGNAGSHLVYAFKPSQTLKKRLGFTETATQVSDQQLKLVIEANITAELLRR